MLDNGPHLSPWDVLSLGTFVPWYVLSLERFVPWDVLSLGTFCPWDVLYVHPLIHDNCLSVLLFVFQETTRFHRVRDLMPKFLEETFLTQFITS